MIAVLTLLCTLSAPDSLLNTGDIQEYAGISAAVKDAKEHDLLALTFPIVTNAGDLCCYQLPVGRRGCSAEGGRHGGLTIHAEEQDRGNAGFALFIQATATDDLWVVSPDCPFDAAGRTIAWIDADAESSFRFFAETARQSEQSLPLALHRDPRGTEILRELAIEDHHDSSFWLGMYRGEAGLNALTDLLNTDPDEDYLAAIAQSDLNGAVDVLSRWSKTTGKLRHQARFWLAERAPEAAYPLLMEALQSESDGESVFALSQLPDDLATPALLDLVKGKYSADVRRQALFWLAESDDPRAIDALVAILD